LAEARRGDEIATITRQIESGSRRVGAVNLSENELLMLELQLDRPVPLHKTDAPPASDEWLVSGRRSQPGGPYRLHAATPAFALSRRGADGEHRAPLAQ
jgi:hypothetical protein